MPERLVAKQAPSFEMDAVLANQQFGKVSLADQMKDGKWTVLFFYPMDFTFVCPTEIIAINERYEDFQKLNAEVIGASTDTIFSHQAWMNTPISENGIGALKFPLAADHNQQVSRKYGVLMEEEGIALRGLFIICPKGELKYAVIHHNNVGRSVEEILRVLEALQTGGLCPANWKSGQQTLNPS